jgi:hypothetical protein
VASIIDFEVIGADNMFVLFYKRSFLLVAVAIIAVAIAIIVIVGFLLFLLLLFLSSFFGRLLLLRRYVVDVIC